MRPNVEGLVVDGEDAEDGLLHRPLAPVIAMDELVVLEPVGQLVVPDELALLPLLNLVIVGAFADFARSCGRRRSHGFLLRGHHHALFLETDVSITFWFKARLVQWHRPFLHKATTMSFFRDQTTRLRRSSRQGTMQRKQAVLAGR
uniref:Uncharacterized protein n=1 Tax=Arundo donax TaxID=35708 RepID=A0A0A9I3J9_ARUDO